MKFTLKKTLKATMLITTAMLGLSLTATVAMAKETLDDASRLYGQGNYKEAARILKDYAEQGDADAQFNIGAYYYLGLGVKKNIKTAKKWIDKSCKNGFQKACEMSSKLF